MLITVKNNPRHMDEKEDQYWKHVLSGDPMFKDFLRNQGLHNDDPRQRAMNQPVCAKCERVGFHHKGGMICAHCGHEGPVIHKLGKHMRDGHYL